MKLLQSLKPANSAPSAPSAKTPKSAFTLIEVTLALGVASFCLLTVFGLLPIGLTSNENASEQTVAAGIATAISADLHSNPVASTLTVTSSTSRFQLVIPPVSCSGTTETLYFSRDGAPTGAFNTTNAVSSGPNGPSRYRATITMQAADTSNTAETPPIYPYQKLFKANILITWPALADPNPALSPTNFSGSFMTATSVDCN